MDYDTKSLYQSCILKFDQRLLFDMEIQQMISKYTYCQNFNTQPFKGCYDDLPAYWLDFTNIIATELKKVHNGN